MSESARRLRDAAMTSRAASDKLQAAVRAVADHLSQRVTDFSKQASDEYESASRLMMIVAAVGIVFSGVLGFVVGQYGWLGRCERWSRRCVKERKEIGETAVAVNDIRAMLADKARQEGATREIARNVSEAAQGTSQVAANIIDVNRGASETGSASAQVLSSARLLSHESNRLKTEVDRLLNRVRAA